MPRTNHLKLNKTRAAMLAGAVIAGVIPALILASSGSAEGQLFCNGKPADVTLTGDTVYTGSEGPDVVVGDGGEQTTHLHKGNDTVCGGAGDDDLQVGKDNDDVFGENGDDILRGRPGIDELDGGFNGQTTVDKGTKRGLEEDDCRGGKPRPDTPKHGDTAVECETERSVIQNKG